EAETVGKILLTPERTLNPKIVGKSAEFIANLAGISVPAGTRCLLADCGGIGRDFPWSIEKLSPTLAFFVADGIEAGAQKCLEILQFGGMGHTAGMHTESREAAIAYGAKMPASRIIINSPTTHGAIGFSTDLAPSMTLGCGSWGGNVTSDNVSPIHLMDIKRVAFETKAVASQPSAVSRQPSARNFDYKLQDSISESQRPKIENGQTVKREQIAAIVDKFLRTRIAETPTIEEREPAIQEPKSGEAKTIIHQITNIEQNGSNGAKTKTVDFVSEDDVKRAIDGGEKIFVTAKTIITPSARDLGEEKEIFAKV
ncbi:MAG TPA: hypothetical protein VNI84_07370, partial [Pyrinomonadaceae bacterium]|nr:hypothetical protein [Pyrinomonadaceae bacterium]